ncbi:MAG: hypothetical protein IK151_09290 [Erysipelotrichaceae bacterium]|nr:hypothetical protein [Erysipelotrichaceae bacterium]
MNKRKLLNDEELDKVSGGKLLENWEHTLFEYAKEYKNKNKSHHQFMNDVKNKIIYEICDSTSYSEDEYKSVIKYVESLSDLFY